MVFFVFVKPTPYVSVCRLIKLPFFVISILFPIFFLLVKFNYLKHLVIVFFTQCAIFFFLKNKKNKKNKNKNKNILIIFFYDVFIKHILIVL